MNLWAKSLGRLAFPAVALFFFSCEDENSFLGFRNPQAKFNVSYAEFPLNSSVMLLDSVRTSNYVEGDVNRLLVGKYMDDQIGEVTAHAFAQFFTTNTSKTLLKTGAQLDSVTLDLRFDFYNYGSTGKTQQTISVHELTKELKPDSIRYLFNRSNATYDAMPLGSKTFAVDPVEFKKYVDDKKDTTITVHIPLQKEFGDRIFASALSYRDAQSALDSAFARYSTFRTIFKGLAFVAQSGDKVVGFSPGAAASRITLHYHDAETDSLQLNLSFNGTVSYNNISANTAGSELAGLTQYHQDFLPANDLRYVQAGTGIVTKVDLDPFFQFADADSNANLFFNRVEVVIQNTTPTDVYGRIEELQFYITSENNRLKKLADSAVNMPQYLSDLQVLRSYEQFVTYLTNGLYTDGVFKPIGENGDVVMLEKVEDGYAYTGYLTRFLQKMIDRGIDRPRFRYFTLMPVNPQAGKGVNRIIFPKDALKLRIYYTRPTENSNPN